MKYVAALAIALVLNAGANLLIKAGMKPIHEAGGLMRGGVLAGLGSILSSRVLILGLLCFGMNAAFYMFALQSPALKISIAYPIMVGGGFAIIALVACFHPAFAEHLTAGQWFGVGLVFVGILLIATRGESASA